MCNCSSNCKCLNSTVVPRGKQGDPGIDGRDGIYGGFAGKWTYNGSVSPTVPTMSGTYQLRFNDSDSADVTEIYVSKTGNYAIDFSDFLASFDNSGSYGRIRIFKEYDSTKFWMGEITSVTDSVTYYTLGVSYITASASVIPTTIFISPTENIVMEFSITGPSTGVTLSYSYANSTTDFIIRTPGTDDWVNICSFIWDGVTYYGGQPFSFSLIYQFIGGEGQTQVQIYDETNSTIICDDNIGDTSKRLDSLAIINSSSNDGAIYTLRAKYKEGETADMRLWAISVVF